MNQTTRIVTLLAAITMIGAANAAAPVEDSMESQAAFVVLPDTASGNVTASSCGGCPSQRLPITSTSKFFIGRKEVTYDELRRTLSADRQLQVLVAYYVGSGQLSRIIVTGKAGQ